MRPIASLRHAWMTSTLLGVLLFVYAPTLAGLARQWAHDDNYSHGFLVPLFAAYVAWQRREQLAAADIRPCAVGVALLLLGALTFVAGQLAAELFLTRISLVAMLAGILGFVWGRGHLRLLAFPLLFLFFMVPLPAVVFNQITLPLQFVASAAGETIIRATGIPVLREGNVLQLPSGNLEVVQACSGIRSLVSLGMAAVVMSYIRGAGPVAIVVSLAAAVPIAIVANALRVAGTGIAANWIGPEVAEGFLHTFTGVVLFGVAVTALAGVCHLVARRPSTGGAA
jgi:exosortase